MIPLERYFSLILSKYNFVDFDKYVPLILVILLLIGISAFFTLAETAYSSVNIIKLRNHLEIKHKGAKKAVYIAEKFDLTLITILVGKGLVNISAITIAAYIINQVVLITALAILFTLVIMLLLIIIFGEIIPKAYSKENAEKVSLNTSLGLYLIIKILLPITWLFSKVKKLVTKNDFIFSPYVTEDELESIIDVMEYEGVIQKDNADLLQSAMTLNEISVYDIMTPRVDIVAIDIDDDIEDIKTMFFENKYSRVPVYDDDIDNILGILTEKDFLTAYINLKPENLNLKNLMIKPNYISTSTKVDELIREMQKLKIHLAIVSDEYGGTSGLVTLEDALEQLVGEIYDESDEYNAEEDPEILNKINDSKFRISAEMELEYLFDELDLDFHPETRFSSVGSFVYKLLDDLSHEGQQVKYKLPSSTDDEGNFVENSLIFTIEKIYARRIKTLTVEIISNKLEDDKIEENEAAV